MALEGDEKGLTGGDPHGRDATGERSGQKSWQLSGEGTGGGVRTVGGSGREGGGIRRRKSEGAEERKREGAERERGKDDLLRSCSSSGRLRFTFFFLLLLAVLLLNWPASSIQIVDHQRSQVW